MLFPLTSLGQFSVDTTKIRYCFLPNIFDSMLILIFPDDGHEKTKKPKKPLVQAGSR
jgi:hypothetical protein